MTADAASRSHRLRWATAIAAAMAVALLLVIGMAIHRGRIMWSAPPQPFLAWPVAGDAAAEDTLVGAARAAWDRYRGPHPSGYPLLVEAKTPIGPVVILQGTDAHGGYRLAILPASRDTPPDELLLRPGPAFPTPPPTQIS